MPGRGAEPTHKTMSMPGRTLIVSSLAIAAVLIAPSAASAQSVDRLLAPEQACSGQSDASRAVAQQVATMVCMHRYARRQAGKPRISPLKKLRKSSRRKARDVRACQDFSHTACGRNSFYWFKRIGFLRSTKRGGENLALGSGQGGTVRSAMQGWLSSPTHRRVILRASYKRIGISMVRGSYRGYDGVQFWVAHLGTKH